MEYAPRHGEVRRTYATLSSVRDIPSSGRGAESCHVGALNLYCSNGWVEIDNNIAENALRGVSLGRKYWLFAGSDAGGERAAVLYSLLGICRLNGVEPEAWLRYVLGHIQDWPVNRLRDLLPWKVDLTSA